MDDPTVSGEPTIRPATMADVEAILALHVASIRRLGAETYSPRQVDAWATKPEGTSPYEASIRDDGRHVIVAERDGELLGWGRLDRSDGEVSAVYVHPDHARQGVGSALVAHLEALAREWGFDRLHLWASLNAVPFYESLGFLRLDKRLHETTGGVVMSCVEMEKPLE